ncbi:MAG: PEP-CTERM sorting domain-containing protein [Kiritimatiellia bacterium]|nr:PEP-CTERM sorting domain-containing protein [Kiritimatiellia bacterium]
MTINEISFFYYAKRTAVLAVLFLAMGVTARAAILFQEDFEGTNNQAKWVGYNGWVSTGAVEVGTNQWVHLHASSQRGYLTPWDDNVVANRTMTNASSYSLVRTLDDRYSIEDTGYRLSFDYRGGMQRAFAVVLRDTNSAAFVGAVAGLQSGNNFFLGGVGREWNQTDTTYAVNTAYSNSAAVPTGWDANLYYKIYVDINGTGSALSFGDWTLDAYTARVTWNATELAGGSHYVVFDLPLYLESLDQLEVRKITATTNGYLMDNLVLESIPEPGTLGLIGAGLGLAAMLRRRRGRQAGV